MPTFITQYSFDPAKNAGEINNEPSLTVPDMAFSIQELLYRFTNMPEIVKDPIYDINPDFESGIPIDVDLTDLDANARTISFLNDQIKNEIDENKRKVEQSGTQSDLS